MSILPVFLLAAELPSQIPESRIGPAAVLAHKAVSGSQGVGKNGPMKKVGYDLALLFHEHREHKKPGKPGALKQKFVPSNRLLRLSVEKVVIDAVASGDVSDLAAELRKLGMENISTYGRFVSGLLPVSKLNRVASLAQLRLARPAYAKLMTGSVTSQGDAAQLSDVARISFGVDGTGVVIGTLSDSYNCLGGAPGNVTSNDLPSGVVVLADESGCASGTDEGRAMMQIVHDVAPGASQAFHTAYGGVADFAGGIVELATMANADVIVDDVIYFAEPMFQDGPIAQAADTVKGMGVSYFSSAGNDASNAYEDVFRNSGIAGNYTGSTRHDFDAGGGVDGLMQVAIAGSTQVIMVLQWDDPFFSVSGSPGADTDVDLALYSSNGQLKAIADINNLGDDPVEILSYVTPPGPTKTYQIGIEHYAGPLPGRVKFIYFNDMTINEYATNSSTAYGHNAAAGARSVGAARYDATPVFGTTPPELEYFSSRGGTTILFDISGNPVNQVRQKPEFVAPDGGDTTFFGNDYEGNGSPNFFGTSAAAPHAAGVAALIKDIDSAITPDGIYAALQNTAIDMGAAGVDDLSGYGLIQANLALASLDTDADGVLNGVDNCPTVANPLQQNNDGDAEGDACDTDDDNDGLSDIDEATYGSDPFVADTDGDNLTDGDEVNTHGTNPVLADTDSDGFNDDVEITAGSDPTDASSIPGEHTGDVNGDGVVDIRDMLLLQRILAGGLTATENQIIRGDVAPLSGGVPAPDSLLNIADYLVLTRKVTGAVTF